VWKASHRGREKTIGTNSQKNLETKKKVLKRELEETQSVSF
jgi:hypothetical protein